MKFFLGALILLFVARAAPPVILSSGWRNVNFEVNGMPIAMTVIELTFDQDLYITVNGNMIKMADFRAPVGEWPAIAYRLQGSLGVTCGQASAKKYNFPNGVPDYILNVPPTNDPVATFFGYFAGFFLQSTKQYRTWPFMLLHGVSGLTGAQIAQCISSGTLQIELFPNPCLPTTAQINQINQAYMSQFPPGYVTGPVYKSADLLCSVTNAAGEAIANTVYTSLPTQPFLPGCNLADVNQLKADVQQLRQQLPNVKNSQNLNGIEFAELAITLRLSYQGCLQRLNQILTFRKRTRNVGSSQDCPDRTNTSAVAFLSNPCCNYREGQCCVARPVTKTFEFPRRVNFTALDQICPGGSQDRLVRRLLKAFSVARNLELKAAAKEDTQKLFDQLFWNVWNECRGSLFSQRCTTNQQCYSRNCDVQGGWCRENPRGQALPIIRCLVEKYEAGDGKLLAAFQDFAGIQSAADSEAVAQGIYSNLQGRFPNAQDCVGQSSWDAKARLDNVRDANGVWTQQIIPVNASRCTQKKSCNWNPYFGLNQQQCETQGGTTFFCGRCQQGGSCYEISRFPQCKFSSSLSYNPSMTQAECTTELSGSWVKPDLFSQQMTCLKSPLNATGDVTTCLDPICPGPNSPDSWISQQFQPRNYQNWACNNQICYTTAAADRAACDALRAQNPGKIIYWDRNYQNGNGLCINVLDYPIQNLPSANKATCAGLTGSGWTYFPGQVYRYGEFYTQQLCANAKVCELPNKGPFPVATDAACTSQTACDRTCPDCVQTVAAEGTTFCATNLNQTTCNEQKARFDTPTGKCLVEVADAAACTQLSGTIANCRGVSKANCGTVGNYQSTLSCQFRQWAPCLTAADCMAQGECEDWDLANWGACNTAGGCPTCLYPFANDPNGNPILRCGVPIVNGYPCENCGQGTQQLYRHSRFGCILQDQSKTPNRTACEASTAPYDPTINGMWVSRAQTQATCEGRAAGCVRYGGWYTKIGAQECTACGGRTTTLYRWQQGRQRPGTLLQLQWLRRAWQSENTVITTLPLAYVQQALEEVVAQFLATLVTARITASYDLRFNVYGAIIERCNDPTANVGSVRGIVGVCRCYGNNRPCQGTCPVECTTPCRYNTLNFIAAVGEILAGRRRLQASADQPVYDGSGALVGVFIGDAYQLNGTLSGQVYLCVPDNVQYTANISAMYTVYDFAPTLPGSGLPGIPMGLPAVRQGTSTCANVTLGDFGLYPILRKNAPFVSTTAAPSIAPTVTVTTTTSANGPAGSTTTTTMPPGSTVAGKSAPMVNTVWITFVGGFVAFAWML